MYFFAEIFPLYFVLLLFWMSCPHGVLARQGKQGSHIDYEAAAGPHISLCQVDFLSDILMQGMCHWQSFAFPLCFTRSTTIYSIYTFKFALFSLVRVLESTHLWGTRLERIKRGIQWQGDEQSYIAGFKVCLHITCWVFSGSWKTTLAMFSVWQMCTLSSSSCCRQKRSRQETGVMGGGVWESHLLP